jgi:hypothetical protein
MWSFVDAANGRDFVEVRRCMVMRSSEFIMLRYNITRVLTRRYGKEPAILRCIDLAKTAERTSPVKLAKEPYKRRGLRKVNHWPRRVA